MVEAAGVEPASENVTGQEPTYLVQFTRRELPRQIRVVRLERTRNAKRYPVFLVLLPWLSKEDQPTV